MMTSGDTARVTVFVAAPPDVAFEVFTQEIDLWWKQGPKFRIAGRGRGMLTFESGVGGRLFETWEGAGKAGIRTLEVGKIVEWSPPGRLVFEWRGVNREIGMWWGELMTSMRAHVAENAGRR